MTINAATKSVRDIFSDYELEIPRYSVLSEAVMDDAKYSAKIIGKKPASTIVA